MKSRIISWFRYHHFSTHPAKENHQDFMGCLNNLEHYSNTVILCEKSPEENWKDILNAINKLDEVGLEKMTLQIKKN